MGHPANLLNAGSTNIWNVTSAEAGFPGSANKGLRTSAEPGTGIVANVVGFPGLTLTRPKWMVPFRVRSMTGFNKSLAPMEVPPVVMSASARSKPCLMISTWASILLRVSSGSTKWRSGLRTYQRLCRGRPLHIQDLPVPLATKACLYPKCLPSHHLWPTKQNSECRRARCPY